MNRITISKAISILDELLDTLTAAYWEVSKIHQKDTLFDILTAVNGERNELAKLSVDDLSMGYEPITAQLPASIRNLKELQKNIDPWFPRTQTATQMRATLSDTEKLFTNMHN